MMGIKKLCLDTKLVKCFIVLFLISIMLSACGKKKFEISLSDFEGETNIEFQFIPWDITLDEAYKKLGDLDEKYSNENEAMVRVSPITPFFIKEINKETDSSQFVFDKTMDPLKEQIQIMTFIISYEDDESRNKDLAILTEHLDGLFDSSEGYEHILYNDSIQRYKKVMDDWVYLYDIGGQSNEDLESYIQIQVVKRYANVKTP